MKKTKETHPAHDAILSFYPPVILRRVFNLLLALAVGLAVVAPGAGRARAAALLQDYTYQECSDIDDRSLRDELNRLAQEAMASNQLDIPGMVDAQWRELGIDAVVDAEIDRAILQVRSEEDYVGRFLSGWSADKAEELTTKVAQYGFGSERFRTKIDHLSEAVAGEVAQELEAASARSASSALLCVQSFIGGNYSSAMVALFEEEIGRDLAAIDFAYTADADVSLLTTHTRSLAGVGVIIGTQIAKRLAKQLAQRIAGRVVGRVVGKAATTIIPIAGWVVGAGLIVWDLVEGGNGALPQIQEALKDEPVKAAVRGEIVAVIEPELRQELPMMARTIANDIYSTWRDFQRKYSQVLALSEENDRFRAILDDLAVDQIYQLSTLVEVGTAAVGPEGLAESIENGQLERVLYLPPSALDILRASQSMSTVVAWADLAGNRIDDVAALELYKLKSPEDFDKRSLEMVLALFGGMGADEAATQAARAGAARLLALDRQTVDVLFTLPSPNLVFLVDRFSTEDLRWLAEYVAAMDQPARNALVARLVTDPAVMAQLKSSQVKERIVESPSVDEAITFLTTPGDETTVVADTTRVLTGTVPWQMFWQKYGGIQAAVLGLAALALVLGGLWFLLRRRNAQTTQVIINVPGEKGEKRYTLVDRE